MNNSEVNNFINKTISKTKDRTLKWKTLSSLNEVKPLPDEKIETSILGNAELLTVDHSYIATFNTGAILLLVFQPTSPFITSTPPDGCTLALRMQDEKSKFSVEISNSRDIFNGAELIRLYNLIDKDSSSVSALINDFLNS